MIIPKNNEYDLFFDSIGKMFLLDELENHSYDSHEWNECLFKEGYWVKPSWYPRSFLRIR
jgi:hypothetical protein